MEDEVLHVPRPLQHEEEVHFVSKQTRAPVMKVKVLDFKTANVRSGRREPLDILTCALNVLLVQLQLAEPEWRGGFADRTAGEPPCAGVARRDVRADAFENVVWEIEYSHVLHVRRQSRWQDSAWARHDCQ
jgi:hypothetical protein